MGWMDFLGGAAAGGIRGVENFENRRRYDQEEAENKRRYEELLQQKAMDRAFTEREASRRTDLAERQLQQSATNADRAHALDREQFGLQWSRFENEDEQKNRREWILGRIASGELQPGSQAFFAEAASAGADPRLLAPAYYQGLEDTSRQKELGAQAALQKQLLGMRLSENDVYRRGDALAQAAAIAGRIYGPRLANPRISRDPAEKARLEREQIAKERAIFRALSDPKMTTEELEKLLYDESTWPETGPSMISPRGRPAVGGTTALPR